MHCRKLGQSLIKYRLDLTREPDESVVVTQLFYADPSGLAGLIRSLDQATNEGKVARAIGLRTKKRRVDSVRPER
ncbi:hypothetical protein LCGC14_1255790 [marine sediment metagenome]|uniref:Uncharacterized protein n=1 Tax=marine sediment metagenome TaxID=412755 RepID=A0A0F9L4W2_9ZZZZ